MMKKFLIMFLLLLVLSTTVFAATLTSNSPTSNTTIYGTKTFVLDFNVVTLDGNGILATLPPKIAIYASPTAGGLQTLIVNDTNLSDGSGILCADYNFFITRDCNYSWVVPDFLTLPIGSYFIDYNMSVPSYLVAGGRTHTTTSSDRFIIQQPMPTSIASMIALALFIGAAGLAVFFAFRLVKGEASIDQGIAMAIAVVVLLIVGWTLYSVAVVGV